MTEPTSEPAPAPTPTPTTTAPTPEFGGFSLADGLVTFGAIVLVVALIMLGLSVASAADHALLAAFSSWLAAGSFLTLLAGLHAKAVRR